MFASLWRLFRIERNEVPLLNSLFWLHFLVIATFTLGKAARDTLFLEVWPATILPWVHIVLVAVTLAGSYVFQKIARGRPARRSLGIALTVAGISYILFGILPSSMARPTAFALYLWSATAGVIVVSQFWSMAEEATDSRSARRLYSVISAGGILGGLFGGLFAATLGRWVGGTGPLIAAGVLMVATSPFARGEAWLPGPKGGGIPEGVPEPDVDSAGRPITAFTVLRHPYVRALALLALVSGMASAVVDFQFKLAVQKMVVGGPSLAVFLGNFYGLQNLAALILQVGFGSLLLSRVGARWSASLLPAGTFLAATAGFIMPVFPLIAVTRLFDGVMRVSVNATATEFFYFPMSNAIRRRVNLFLSSVVNRAAEALAAVALLAVGAFLAMNGNVLWALLALLSLVWLALLGRVGNLYVEEVSESLQRMVIAPASRGSDSREAILITEIRSMLENPSPARALYALSLLDESDPDAAALEIPNLLKHPAMAVRLRAIEMALRRPEVVDLLQMEALLRDDEEEVRVWAALFFSKLTVGNPLDNLKELLESPNPRVRASALEVAVQHAAPSDAERVIELARRFLARGEPLDRRAVARAIGMPGSPRRLDESLPTLLADESEEVRQEAMGAVARMGRRDLLPRLLGRLADPRDRGAARNALAAWGDRIVGTLGDHLADPVTDPRIRRQIPQILAQIGSPDAVSSLLRMPAENDPQLDLHVLKALNRVRNDSPDARFSVESVSARIRDEAFGITRRLVYRRAIGSLPEGRGRSLLLRAFEERLTRDHDRLFRRLALIYPAREIHLAFLGLSDPSFKTQAQSIEYLASTLSPPDRMSVLPLVDLMPDDERVHNASSYFRFPPRDARDSLRELIEGPDEWLKACALFLIGEAQVEELSHLWAVAVESPERVVQDTARWMQARFLPA